MKPTGTTQKYSLVLETRQIERLEALRKEWNLTVSEQVRMAIDAWINDRTSIAVRVQRAFAAKAKTK